MCKKSLYQDVHSLATYQVLHRRLAKQGCKMMAAGLAAAYIAEPRQRVEQPSIH